MIPIVGVTAAPDNLPDDIAALRAALAAEQLARREAEARASGAEAMVAHLKLLIAKLKRDSSAPSSERGRKLLDQLELQLEELEARASEDAAKAENAADKDGRVRRSDSPPAASRCARRCRPTCRASGSSCRRRPPARAAAASWPSWARTSPRRWRSCRVSGR